MKLELDENIGRRGQQMLTNAGHDVATVVEQNLTSAADIKLINVCQQEERALITLDLDFSNPLRFQPSRYAGIAVLRLPKQPSHQDLLDAIATLIKALETNDLMGKLWIVQKGAIRIYQENN